MTLDYVIVGGGSAGCVLANRLSALSNCKVLLVEAGPDTPHGKVPAEILDSYPGTAYFDPRYHWRDLKAFRQPVPHNDPGAPRHPPPRYEQPRVLGGGSSINGQIANRGMPSDYDDWERSGASGWGWEQVLPYFCKVERDLDFEGDLHGREGRIPIRRIFPDLWPEHAKAAAAAFAEQGFPYVEDQNADFRDGYFPFPISNAYERRVSSAIGYLDPSTRRRPNLRILTDTQVTGLLFDGKRCTGVRLRTAAGGFEEVAAREIILSAGAIHSRAILLRAGIGPPGPLAQLGIKSLVPLEGVGQRLMEHPSVALSSFIRPAARLNTFSRRHMLVGLRYSSGIGGAAAGDMFLAALSKSAWHAVGTSIGSFLLCVYRTVSETGQVKLVSSDWEAEPRVELNLLSDRRDLDRLVQGFRMAATLQNGPSMRAVTSDPFPTSYSERVRRYGAPTRRNRILTDLLARALDGPAPIRRYLMEHVVREGSTLQTLLRDDDALEAFIRKAVAGVWHPGCTCRMGRENDPIAVVTADGRVRGADGLRVVDASIFPALPSGNTNLPVMMAAEKMSDTILQQRSSGR